MKQGIGQSDPVQNSVEISVMPGRNGGTLLRGSNFRNKGGGRTKSEVRAMCLEGFGEAVPEIIAIATGKRRVRVVDQISAFDKLGKYGLDKVTVLVPDQLAYALAEVLAEDERIPSEALESIIRNVFGRFKELEER